MAAVQSISLPSNVQYPTRPQVRPLEHDIETMPGALGEASECPAGHVVELKDFRGGECAVVDACVVDGAGIEKRDSRTNQDASK